MPGAMSDTFDHSGLPEDELLAAEYALGVLDGIDRATAEQRMARDRGFARQVAAWEQRLAPWAAEIPEMLPAPHVWDRIAGALPPQPARAGLWQSLAFWRGLSLAAGVLAAACLAALIYLGTFTQTEPLVATIEGGGQRHFVATVDVKRVPELWLIPPDGKPRPVGLLRGDAPVTLTLSGDLSGLAKNNAVLAVSLEPPGGSTTGLPTGPVIGTGKLTNL